MELIVISESQIKLMLSKGDLASYSGSAGKMVRDIIRDAHDRFGIGNLDGRVFVEYYPSKEGGCELFVTRLSASRALTSAPETLPAPIRQPASKTVYAFSAVENLLSCCAALSKLDAGLMSAAYVDRSERVYYLCLEKQTPIAPEHLGALCPAETYLYISEHCDVLCAASAAEKLGALA